MSKLLIFLLSCNVTFCYSIDYNKSYSPTPGQDVISSSGVMGEFDDISTVLNGNLDSGNVKDGTLTNSDLLASTIENDRIADETIKPSDIQNLGDMIKGDLVYASASDTFQNLAIGTTNQVLTVSGGLPTWQNPSSGGWTDTGSLLHPDSADDNIVIGGSAAGASALATLVLYNNTVPTGNVTDGVQLYSEDVVTAELRVRDEAGNVTTLSPHNTILIPQERIDKYERECSPYWTYYSKNDNMEINVDMYGAIKELERITKQQFIYEKEVNREGE